VTTESILTDVRDECDRAVERHGEQLGLPMFHPLGHCLMSGTMAKHYCNSRSKAGEVSWGDIVLEEIAEAFDETEDMAALRAELVQTAAMCVNMIRALDHQGLT
jgi:hypothetical protein